MIKIFNTLTRQKEEFVPLKTGKISFYQCGPTLYWVQHIGNMRAMVAADIVSRTLMAFEYDVTFVRNYTDVGHLVSDADTGEDKMEKGAKREGLSPQEIAKKYQDIFEKHVDSLNIRPPTHKPAATMYIDQMIELVSILLEKGYAYVTSKAVYFDVSKFKDYNKLNRQRLDQNIEGAGSGETTDPDKKNPFDFSLWLFKTGDHKNAIQTWKSPFKSSEVTDGEGFPGWHVECSAMSKELLGDTIDIHMGGIEHIPIHHTNEIAQSEAASGKIFVNYWIHNEHLTVDGAKMSKSEGTSYSLDDVIAKGYHPLDLRYFFLLAHYRSKQNFTWDALSAAQTARTRLLAKTTQIFTDVSKQGELTLDITNNKYMHEIMASLGDDFDTPKALATLWKLLRDDTVNSAEKLGVLLSVDQVSAVGITECVDKLSSLSDEFISQVENIIDERTKARKSKDFATADKLRDQLNTLGVSIMDSTEDSEWTIKNDNRDEQR
ncbi:cysteine--tRNA ligase [Candidatus Dojkabacteria bacterium]|nr:cysteine--tRNA ligase [Candidatus Dojkabacteria bacterium]